MSEQPLHRSLYARVVVAILLGVLVGYLWPDTGAQLKPLGDAFIKLIKMIITPIIFTTVVVGIAGMGDMKKVGRVGVKALIYFEVVTTFALALGLIVVKTAQPGAGLNVDPATLDAKALDTYTAAGRAMGAADFLLNIIPSSVVDAFAKGEILQVLLFSVLMGGVLASMGDRGRNLVHLLDQAAHALFAAVAVIMKVAPIGAFGAMAFTVGKYGISTLLNLGKLMACFYATSLLFVLVVLGAILRTAGVSILSFLKYIREELLIVLGTSSSESVLPRMMDKMERLGCARSVVGLVIPTGYSFNLDGTSIYLTMAALFVAQACNVSLSLGDELGILGVLLLTSKGAAAVTGGGFITLAATLSSTRTIPVAGLALLLGIDRFMSEARALTNLVGNGVATIMIAKWENSLDAERMKQELAGSQASER